ncbi:MAG: PAS domain S-box protein, partial [Pseudomonadota bacterium]
MIADKKEKTDQREILVVDDTPASLQLLTHILTGHGYRVRPASCGLLALRSVAAKAPDLILLDVKMPDMDGLEVCRRLKSDERCRDIPVLFISGLGETAEKVKGFGAGGQDYITKPFETEEVLARVGIHLRLRELTEGLEQKVSERTGELTVANFKLQQEINERRHAEEALRESEARLRTLIQTIPDLIWLKDPDGVYLACNTMFERFFGAKEADIVGKTDYDFVDRELADFFREHDRKAMSMGKPSSNEEWITFAADGRRALLDTIKTPIYDTGGRLLSVLGISRDITERKLLEEKLVKSENRLKTIIETEPECIKLITADGTLLEMNPAGLAMIEADSLDQVRNECIYTLIDPKYRERFMQLNGEVFEGKTGMLEFELTGLKGTRRWMETNAVPFHDSDGKIIAMLSITRDITGRKREEEEKEKLQDQLNQAQKMESVGRLAGGVAHDFNNMLGVILGYTELALEKVDPSEPLYHNLREILAATKRSAEITRQLLAFARKQTITPRVIDLNETVEGMLKMLRRLIGENIDLAWLPNTNLWPVKVDSSQIDQLLANICVNARDAVADVGKVTIETANVAFDHAFCANHPGFVPGEYVLLA